MKIICTCGHEIHLSKIGELVIESSKYDSLVFPGIECSECGHVYVLRIGLEHI